MQVSYSNKIPEKKALFELFVSTGWNEEYCLSSDDFYLAVQKSWFFTCAYENKKLVGFGRIISDGVLHSLIVDLMILPMYQKIGIGKNILSQLIQKAKSQGIKDIQLFCAEGKKDFYLKQNFIERNIGSPGMDYKK